MKKCDACALFQYVLLFSNVCRKCVAKCIVLIKKGVYIDWEFEVKVQTGRRGGFVILTRHLMKNLNHCLILATT